MMRPKISDLEAFEAVSIYGSFRKAAEHLGVSKPQISRRISGLEAMLNVRLLNRASNFVSLTPIGADFSQRVHAILHEMDIALEFIDSEMGQQHGTIRIHSAMKFGTMYLRPAINEFMDMHPGVDIQMILDDHCEEALSEEIDFSLRVDRRTNSDLKMRHFKTVNQSLVCSPSFMKTINLPFDVGAISCYESIVFKDAGSTTPWVFEKGDHKTTVFPKGRIVSNNWEYILAEAIDGAGLALLPQFVAKQAIDDGTLVELLDVQEIETLDLFALFPARYIMPLRVRKLIDFLVLKWKRPMPCPSNSNPNLVQACLSEKPAVAL